MSTDDNQPADPPTVDPRHPRGKRSHFKTGLKRDRSRLVVAIPTIDATVVDDARNVLNSNEQVAALDPTQPSSSRARGQQIRRTRELMIANAERYARAHIESVERALAMSHIDPKYTDVARRGAEFALANISDDGERIITKEQAASPTLPTMQIGIMLGGLPQRKQIANE